MVNCSILKCKNRTERNVPDVSYHAFPHNEILQTIWVNATGRRNWTPSHTARICSIHFEEKYIKKSKQKSRLHNGAVPTIRVHDIGLSKSLPPKIPSNLPSTSEQKKIPKQSTSVSLHGGNFTKQEKQIIINAYMNIKKTWPKEKTPYKTLLFEKTAAFLGLPLHDVSKTLREHECNDKWQLKSGQFTDKINKYVKIDVQKTVHNFYMQGEIPTTKKVYQIIKDRYPNINPVTFKKVLEQMRFQYIKKNNTYAMIDNEDIIKSRVNYLRKIKKYKRQEHIYYVDEMCLTPDADTEIKKNRIKSLVVVHIGDQTGFVKDGLGYFITSNDIKATTFEKWFKKVLPKLKENSIVVMDDTPYHSSILDMPPTMDWSKENIKTWMRNKGIDFEEGSPKIVLIDIVRNVSIQNKLYEIDKIANERNIEILRTPIHHDLNPLKVIWDEIKTSIMKYNTTSIDGLRKLVEKAIDNLPATRWLTAVKVVEKEENVYSNLDSTMDDVIDEFLEHSNNDLSSGETTVSNASSGSEGD